MRTFTPRVNEQSGERLHMRLNGLDYDKIKRGEPWQAIVTDQNTGTRYRVAGADCGSPGCFCDAVIVERLGSN